MKRVKSGDEGASWIFDARAYSTFDQYRYGARQEQGSNLRSDKFSLSCGGEKRPSIATPPKAVTVTSDFWYRTSIVVWELDRRFRHSRMNCTWGTT